MTPGEAAAALSTPDGMREMACLFCAVHDEQLRFAEGIFRVVECRRCGHVYVNPRLSVERLHEMYQEEYWTSDRAKEFGYTSYLAEAPLYLRTYRVRSRVIDAYKPKPGRVLDVGCAAGFFLAVMAERGWKTTGIEISKPMVDYARDELGLSAMHRGDLLSVDLGDDPPFDLITLWDVVEHLERPDEHLARATELLADDGILVLETQNVASTFARLMGRRWQHYKHEEHLYHFHPDSMRRLLADAGLQIVENTSRRGGKYVTMSFLVERMGKLHPALSVLAAPLRLAGGLSFYVNLADEMIVVAKKA